MFLIFFLCTYLSSVSSFPLKMCDLDHKEILFLIDCSHEVREQIDFIKQTVDYLRYNRNWTSLNVSYMSLEDNVQKSLEELTANITEKSRQISEHCNGTVDIDELFLKSNEAQRINKLSTLSLNLIFINLNFKRMDLLRKISEIQEKDYNENFRFFILSSKQKNVLSLAYFYYIESFKDVNIFNLFSKICDLKCTDTDFTFISLNFQRSFYHVDYTNISHKEGVEYCDKYFNSYLVSIETYEELNYLMGKILKTHLSSESINFHLGLAITLTNQMYWSSGNPFIFYHEIQQHKILQCIYFHYIMNVNSTLAFKNNKNIWKYLHQIECEHILNETYVVCECHQQLQTDVDIDINPIQKPDTFSLVHINEMLHYFIYSTDYIDKIHTLDCVNASYTPYEENNYFCKEKNLSDSVLTYVTSSYVKKLSEKHCFSMCFPFLTIYSGNKINSSIALSESYCYKPPEHKCLTNIVNIPQDISLVSCKSKHGFFDSPKCLRTDYHFSCKDNSYLENCEHIKCPNGFIKCPNSYCVPISWLNFKYRLCPLGQEISIFTRNRRICSAKISLKINDICIHPGFLEEHNMGQSAYNCDDICPTGYKCLSYKSRFNLTPILSESIKLYNISNSFLPSVDSYLYISYLKIIEIKVSGCKIQNLDKALKHWKKTQTVILDLSKNEISDSGKLQSVTSMSTLRFLNLSHNVKLSINEMFVLPFTLEVIDLSYTSVEFIPKYIFGKLHSLRLLNLSYTRINKFDNIGLPQYFILDILTIEGVMMTEIKADFYEGLTVQTGLWSSDFKLCCPQILGDNIPSSKCHAPNDAISSCKNVVGDTLKRILVWVVGLMTIVGNGIVLIYRVVWCRENIFEKAYGLFVTGLAVSDFLMGVYLMIIAAVDMFYTNVYVVYDANWRNSFLCQFSGFLSTFSSETSTFLIVLITLDRFISFSNPFRVYDTLKNIKWKCFISVWIIGFVLAIIPAVVPEWQIYSSNGLCLALPLSTTASYRLPGWEFSMAVFIILNFSLFLFISIGQVGIFLNIIKTRNLPLRRHCSEKTNHDIKIAMKLAFVALSDFLCWFPIGIMGILSLCGQEFEKETYAWMAVFVLPVNSALNPVIYTIPIIIDSIKCKKKT